MHGKLRTSTRIARNTAWLVVAKFSSRIMSAVFIILLANHLLPVNFGIFNLALAVAYIAAVVVDFGFDEMTIRSISRRPEVTSKLVSNVLMSRVILSFLYLAILAVIYRFILSTIETGITITVLLLAGGLLIIEKIYGSFNAIFQGHERMDLQGKIDFFGHLLYLFAGISALFLGLDLEGIILFLLFANIIRLIISAVVYTVSLKGTFQKPNTIVQTTKGTVHFTSFAFLAVFYGHIIILLLSLIVGDFGIGVYSASWKVVIFLGVVPYSFGRALYPVFSRMYQTAKQALRYTYRISMRYMLALSLPITVGLYVSGHEILGFIYIEEYSATLPVFRILIWVIPFLFMNGSLKMVLWSTDQTKLTVRNLLFSSIFLILSALYLIPRWGVQGAAAAVVFAEMLHFIINYHQVSLTISPVPLSYLWKPFGASMVMAAALFIPLSITITIPISILLYFVLLYLLKAIEPKDFELLRSLFKNIS